MCIQGSCVPNQIAPVGNCLFGDDVITQNLVNFPLPSPNMTCQTLLDYIADVRKESPYAYCSLNFFENTCCSTCRSEIK